jgi:hypothetical protein
MRGAVALADLNDRDAFKGNVTDGKHGPPKTGKRAAIKAPKSATIH